MVGKNIWVLIFVHFLYKAHPLDFVVIFDTNSRSVLEIQDLPISGSRGDKGNTIPRKESNYLRHLSKGGVRKDSKPIRCDSPEGVSFTINGTEVHWQKWKMRLGLVLVDLFARVHQLIIVLQVQWSRRTRDL